MSVRSTKNEVQTTFCTEGVFCLLASYYLHCYFITGYTNFSRKKLMNKLFGSIGEQDKKTAIEKLIHSSSPRPDFFLMVVLSVVAASFGLFLNNVAIVIGSTLIAPILLPVLSISMGLVMSDFSLISRSIVTTAKSIAIAIGSAIAVTLLFYGESSLLGSSMLISDASIQYFLVAVVAGITVAFALVKPDLNEILPGAAMAVTLIPPLASIGIGLASFNGQLVREAGVLFFLNLTGVIGASMIVFSLMNLYVDRKIAERAVKKEDRIVKLK
jgi:uncharacterized hydrophobic protein (TIGR00271 family)